MNHLTTLSKRLIAFLMALTILFSVVPAMAEVLPEIEAVEETEMLETNIQNLEESVDEVSIIELPPDDETVISDLPDEDSVASEFINDLPESETTTDNETVETETEIAEDEMLAEESGEQLPSEETVPEEAAGDVNQEKTEPEIPTVEEAEDLVEEVNPEEGVSEELPAEESVSELMNPVQAAVAEKGYTYLMTDNTIPVYETEQLQKLVFTLYPENLVLVSAYLEQDNRNVLEVRFYASEEMAVIGYVDALSLSDHVLEDEEIRSFVADRPYLLDFVGNGKVAIFLASGEMPVPQSQVDMEDNELEETEQEVLPEEELVPGDEPGALPEEDPTQSDTGSENESVVETHPGEDVISVSIPSVEESTQDSMEETAEDLTAEPEKVYASCLDYLLVTDETVVYSDVDCSIEDEYLGDLAMGYFIRDSVVQVRDVITDENNRVWYQVNYLYGDDCTDGRMKWTDITSVFVLANQTEATDETELTITDFAFKTKPQMRMMMRSTPMNGFRLKELNDPMGDFHAGQSNLHGSSGRDVEYTQIATLPGRGNIYATPHYLEGYTVYCLEHLLPGPGENLSGGRKEPTGPYLMVDMQEYINTPGYSGVMYSESTMHAIAWVLRHTYPFMVLDRTDPSNETWSRVAGQFAIREVIKELEGPQYLRDYWLMDEFYASSNNAPAVYLEYARWLAANGIARARITGEILIADQHVTIVNGKTVGTVTLSTDADLIRIPLAAGEVSGNTAGNDDQYYYLHSGDTVQISSELRQFSVTVESISSPDEEACFLVGVPDAPIQKVLVPQKGTPYKLGDNILNFEVVYGSLQAMKKDSVTDLPLAGATFDLLQDGVIIQSKTTGADGIVVFYDLLPGTYSVQESKAPDGYVLNTASVEQISVEVGEIAEVEFFNRPIRSKVQIVKTDTLTNEAVSGAEFTIQDAEGNVVAVMITDANGQAVSDWLPYGIYTVTETKVPAGYKESGFTTEINACENEKIYTVEVQNEPMMGYIQLTKADSRSNQPIKGVTFDIYQGTSVVATMTTDANGVAVSPALPKGQYLVKEKENPTGYVSLLKTQEVTVRSDSSTSIEVENDPVEASIQIVKKDAMTKEYLAGAEFTITRISGIPSQNHKKEVVAVITTDANGVATSPLLTWGTYQVKETKAPVHYVSSGFNETIELHEHGKIYTLDVENEPTQGGIRLTKTDALNGNTIAGVKFNVYQGDTLITTMTTNKNGVATVENLPKGKYTVKEAALPEGYAGDLVELEAVVMSDQVTELVAQNIPSQSKVKIMKRDALTEEPVAGAEFTITNQKKEVVAVLVTGNDGTTVSDWLPYGVYTVKETKAAEHYENSGFTAKVEAYEDGKTYELDVENTPNKGQIQINKMDALTGKTIAGVQFDIFQGDTLIGTMKTDKNGVAVSDKLEKGQYMVKEHENPVGYVAELVTLEALVKSDETTVLTAVNVPIQGKVRIEKTDALTGETLAGAEFTITDQEGNEVAVIVTDENGVAESPLLTYGTYRIKETKVPEHYVDTGYILEMTIDIHEKTYVLPVSNEPAKGWIRLTKTDRMNGNPIEGVQFDIYHNDQYGNGLAGSMVTDKNGVALSEPLRKGQYIVREHGETPGYVFEEILLDATVKSAEITELAATNQPVMVQLKIYKRDLEEYDGDNPNSDPKKRKKVKELPVISAPVTRGDGVLVGTEFEVYAGADILDRQGNVIHKKGDMVIESLTTAGEDASVTTEPLWPGLYAIREKKAPEGYLIDTEPFFVDASDAAEQSSLVTVSYAGLSRNEIMYGAQAIVKLLGDNNMNADPTRVETPEEGAEFVVYLQSAGSFEAAREYERDVLVTDENGYAMTKPLPYGIYVLEQTKGEPGYEIKGPIPFQIDGTENLMNPPPMALNDVPILYRLRFIKVDAETGNSITLANTSFKMKDADGNYVKHQVHYPSEQWVDTFVTDETGSVTLPEAVNWGMYYLQEVKAPEGYLIHADDFAVFVGNNTDLPGNTYKLAIEIPNEPVKGRILLDKTGLQLTGYDVQTDPWGNEVHVPVYEDQYLAGAVFEVRADEDVIGKDGTVWYKQGDLADTITTTQQGSDVSKLLPLGKYSLIETQAPRGYFFDPMPIPVELTYKDDHTAVVELRVEVGNDYYPAEITLSKEIDELNIITSGADSIKSILSKEPGEGFVFGLFNRYDMPYANGTLMADTLIATGITNENGELVLGGKYPHGDYYIRELSGPDGWKLSSEMVPVTIGTEYANRKDQVLRVVLDEPIHNELIHTRVTLTKTDITGEKTLPGAVIEVMNATGQVVYRDKTDEHGQIANIPVVPGDYTFREVYAPDGYALSEAVMTFTVEKDGTVIGDTVIRDDYTRFSILKTDQHGNVLPGVTFGLYQQDGTLLMTAITDKNGKATFERVPFGSYEIAEMKPPVGYVASLVRIPVKLDGTWVNPEEPLETVVNVPNYVLVRKTDPDGVPLPGAVFVMHDEYGDCFGRSVTDASGMARFEKMPYGHYYIREEAAPEGYLVNKEVVKVVIDSSYQSKEEPIATIMNQRKRVRFIKVDTSGRRMPDVEFTMYNALTDEVVEVVESNEKGEFIFTKFDFGSWIIRETRCPEGYTPIEDILLEVDETWVEPKAITLVNIPNHYAFQKTDHWYRPLEGVWFTVEDPEGHILQEVCSGEDGMVYISDLVPGRYIIRETDAAEGFTRTEETIELIVDEKYVAPTKPYRLVNYPSIETGVYLTPTTVTWIGAGLMVLAGVIFFISRKKKRKEKK